MVIIPHHFELDSSIYPIPIGWLLASSEKVFIINTDGSIQTIAIFNGLKVFIGKQGDKIFVYTNGINPLLFLSKNYQLSIYTEDCLQFKTLNNFEILLLKTDDIESQSEKYLKSHFQLKQDSIFIFNENKSCILQPLEKIESAHFSTDGLSILAMNQEKLAILDNPLC